MQEEAHQRKRLAKWRIDHTAEFLLQVRDDTLLQGQIRARYRQTAGERRVARPMTRGKDVWDANKAQKLPSKKARFAKSFGRTRDAIQDSHDDTRASKADWMNSKRESEERNPCGDSSEAGT